MSANILEIVVLQKNSGVASFVMNVYRHIDHEQVSVEFLTWIIDDSLPTYIEEIYNWGGKVHVIPYYRKHPLQFIQEAEKVIASKRFSAIHCHEFLISLPMLYFAKKHNIFMRIAHSHNPDIESTLKKLLVILCRGFFKRYSTIFMACSKESGEFLFGDDVNIIIIKNGIDVQKFEFSEKKRNSLREKLNLQNKFVIGNIGRLVTQKNQLFLLDIFAQVLQEKRNAILLIIGDGNQKKLLKQRAEDLLIQKQVFFLGVREDVADLLNVMDVFALTSIYEGLGIVLVESQANGLPCIASDVIPKEVKMSENFSFLPLDASISEWSKQILNSSRIVSSQAKSNVIFAGYDIHNSAKKLQEIYLSSI